MKRRMHAKIGIIGVSVKILPEHHLNTPAVCTRLMIPLIKVVYLMYIYIFSLFSVMYALLKCLMNQKLFWPQKLEKFDVRIQ